MLTFEQKIAIISDFPELTRKDVSLGRVNFHFDGSLYEKKIVVHHLHPGGNGFIYAALVPDVQTDDKGFVNIRSYSEQELRDLLREAIDSLAVRDDYEAAPAIPDNKLPGDWINAAGQRLVLSLEENLWYLYDGPHLEMAFETTAEARAYLQEEGFSPA